MRRAVFTGLLMFACVAAHGAPPRAVGTAFQTEVPECAGNVILGRPTDCSVTASILLRQGGKVQVIYGLRGKPIQLRTEAVNLPPNVPKEVLLGGLERDMAYEYRVVDADTGAALLPAECNGSFHTSRSAGAEFLFTITADSHLDQATDLSLYRRTFQNIASEAPDFHIDLGDTFMTEKQDSRESAARQYAAQRYWFGLIGLSAPVFLVLGNHDGEAASPRNDPESVGMTNWSLAQRKRLFPNPVPSGFYSGDSVAQPDGGTLQDYYSWEWGDALFIVLDPYWYSTATRGGREPWNMTLGKTQYDWLNRTLRASKAKFKFVFIHQLLGGLDANARGGAEAATLYEWGGHEKSGTDDFAARRPGWEEPVHNLLAATGVTVVFHGHDHFFAHQELDGVTYQLVPQPGCRNVLTDHAFEYGYVRGDFLPSSGFLTVRVAADRVIVRYLKTDSPTPAFVYECGVRQ